MNIFIKLEQSFNVCDQSQFIILQYYYHPTVVHIIEISKIQLSGTTNTLSRKRLFNKKKKKKKSDFKYNEIKKNSFHDSEIKICESITRGAIFLIRNDIEPRQGVINLIPGTFSRMPKRLEKLCDDDGCEEERGWVG